MTSGSEWRLRVGWAVRREQEHEGLDVRGLTPCARIGIIDGRVNITEVHFAHETLYLRINRGK